MKPTIPDDTADRASALRVLGSDREGNPRPDRAEQKINALRQWADEQAPDEGVYARVWARLEAAHADKAKVPTPAADPWWRRWFGGQPLGFALASLVLVTGAAVLWQGVFAPDEELSGNKGLAQRIAVHDLQATPPALVAELKALGLSPRLERRDGELAVSVQLPEKIPESVKQWAARWGVKAVPGQVMRVVLYHRDGAAGAPSAPQPMSVPTPADSVGPSPK